MKIAILHGPRDLRVEDHDLHTTELGPKQIWVETEITGFKIGTDRGNYEGAEQVPGAPDFPRWVGDSNLGYVRGIGNEVQRFAVGDRVVSRYPHQSEYVAEEDECIVKVPEGVAGEDAVFAHLYALSSYCYHKGQFRASEHVAVVGLGVLGLGAVALGPLLGARVAGIGNDPVRLEMAQRIGAHAVFMSNDEDLQVKLNEFSGGRGIDLVILAANPWPAFRTAVEIVRISGRVSVVGLNGRGEAPLDFNPLDMRWFWNKGITLTAANGFAADPFPDGKDRFDAERLCAHVLSLMQEGKLEPKKLITHRLHYSEMVEAYEMAYRREKNMLNVVFDWKD